MSTGYGWEGIRQVCATLLGARHVPERLCGGSAYLGRYNKCSTFIFYLLLCTEPNLTWGNCGRIKTVKCWIVQNFSRLMQHVSRSIGRHSTMMEQQQLLINYYKSI